MTKIFDFHREQPSDDTDVPPVPQKDSPPVQRQLEQANQHQHQHQHQQHQQQSAVQPVTPDRSQSTPPPLPQTLRPIRYSGDLELTLPFDKDPAQRPSWSFQSLVNSTPSLTAAAAARAATMSGPSPSPAASSTDLPPAPPPHDIERPWSAPPAPAKRSSMFAGLRPSLGFFGKRPVPPPPSHQPPHQPPHQAQPLNADYQMQPVDSSFSRALSFDAEPIPFFMQNRYLLQGYLFVGSLCIFASVVTIVRTNLRATPDATFASLQYVAVVSGASWVLALAFAGWYTVRSPALPRHPYTHLVTDRPFGAAVDTLGSIVLLVLWIAAAVDTGLRASTCLGYDTATVAPVTCSTGIAVVVGELADILAVLANGVPDQV
ncbi:hypothetical protein BC831DRAFT_549898 [Entophlyctis helioformis]|nr:hypothetical protein BC831DRAFT_549898 [Entophlyctis helioformis]